MKAYPLLIADLRGGRNGIDPPALIPDDQCLEAMNIDWAEGSVGHKRLGSSALGVTFSAGGPFGNTIGSMVRYVPQTGGDASAELWAVATGPVVGRLAASTQWTAPTYVDSISDEYSLTGVSLGDLFHQFYNSSQNRSHVWDGTRVRRSGLATPDPPTVATLGGAGLTFTRYYRIRTYDNTSGKTRRSEPSTSVSITITDDSGVQVTRPTLPTNEHETHWEVEYASASAGPWYRAAQVATGTSTYDDTASSISTTNLSAPTGRHVPPPSAKFAVTIGSQILMAGCHETSGGYTTAHPARAWWTPAVGTLDVGDTERVVDGSYLGLEAPPTGIGGPFAGSAFVFGSRHIWEFLPTNIAATPFRKYTLRTDVGCLRHQTICVGDDEHGAAALYFLSADGPYRITSAGAVQYLGADIEDVWSTLNYAATAVVAHSLYHAGKRQVWNWIATGSSNYPLVKLVFDTKNGRMTAESEVRKGWSRHNGPSASVYCSCLFANTVGATMSSDLKPYVGLATVSSAISKCDDAAAASDATGVGSAEAFQAYIDTKEYGRLGFNHAVRDGLLIGEVSSGVTITVTPKGDYGLTDGQAGTALLTAAGSETRVSKRLDGLQHAGVGSFRLRVGDASAIANTWTLEAVLVHVTEQEVRG